MPEVIANASPLINLAAIECMELVREYHGRIAVPPAVWREVVIEGEGKPGASELVAARSDGWIQVMAPTNESLIGLLKRELDEGEAEAIALAVERNADLILLDERDARRAAATLGLQRTGVVGILMRAKLSGRFVSVPPTQWSAGPAFRGW